MGDKSGNAEKPLHHKLMETVLGRNAAIFEEALTGRKRLLFESTEVEDLLYIECPSCRHTFGISAEFAHKHQLIHFKYTCPYCDLQRRLQD